MPESGGIELTSLGLTALRQGNPSEAASIFERALTFEEVRNDPLTQVDVANALGFAYRLLGRLAEAETCFTEALRLGREQLGPNHSLVGTVLENLATLKYVVGDRDQGRAYVREAITVHSSRAADQSQVQGVADTLVAIGRRCLQFSAVAETELAWQEAMRTLLAAGLDRSPAAEQIGLLLFNLFDTHGRRLEAMRAMRDALVTGPQPLWKQLIRYRQLEREKLMRRHRVDVDRLLSNLLRWPTDDAAARTALEVLLWRRGFALDAYRAANRAGRRDPVIKTRLDALKRARAGLAEMLFHTPPDPKRPHATQIHWEGIRRSPEVDALEADLLASLTEADCRVVFHPPDCTEVAGNLPEDAALIEYWRCRQSDEHNNMSARYLALVLRPGDPPRVTMLNLCAADEVEQGLLQGYLSALQHGAPVDLLPRGATRHLSGTDNNDASPTNGWRADGQALRALIFDPLLPSLEGARQLFIVADGLLTRLPFAALPTDDGFVIDRFTISYLESGRHLCAEPTATDRPGLPLVMAAPDYNWGTPADGVEGQMVWFDDLPGTRVEGEQVAARLGVAPIVGRAATKRTITNCHSPLILHVSTHGVLLPVQFAVAEIDPFAPMEPGIEVVGTVRFIDGLGRLSGVEIEDQALRSMLVAAGANTWLAGGDLPEEVEDGLLNAEDIALVDLSGTELAVLSACETGLGSIEIGEGVLGLRSAFSVAGVRTLITSLWRLPDEDVTPELMVAFYNDVCGGRVGRAEALRRAQLAFRQRDPDRPDLWGPLICQGQAGPLSPDLLRQSGVPA